MNSISYYAASSSSSSPSGQLQQPPTSVGPRSFPESTRVFHEISSSVNSDKLTVVGEIFRRILTPLYGSQDKALQQIAESKDRRCYLLYDGEIPMGVLVFKTVLSNEFAEYGIKDSIEIKSLFVDNSQENSGKGFGSDLVKKVVDESEKLGIGHTGIHVTVSETKTDSLTFFKKKGFNVAHAWKDRYIQGTTEFLLSCPRVITGNGEAHVADLAHSLSHTQLTSPGKNTPLLRVVHAHDGDIHILTALSDGHFVSGAKDNCIYKWDENGVLVKVVDDVEPKYQLESDWVTAAERINKKYWVTARRNGNISLWKTGGEYVKGIKLNFPRKEPIFSHELNKRRVTCIAKGLDPENPTIFVGVPTEFEEYSLVEGKSVASTVVDINDWPYCIVPLAEESLLLVIGARIAEWRKTQGKWNHSANIMSEGKKAKGAGGKWYRPFISSLKPMDRSAGVFALSDFTGAVKVLDLASKKVVSELREHEKRVWTTEVLSTKTFASAGEDGLVKIWDARQSQSVRTIREGGTARQVNTLLNLKENILVAGTGASEAPEETDRRAQLRFYDLRK